MVFQKLINIENPPTIPDTLSHTFRDFISKCLEIDPNCRFDTDQLLNHPFIVYGDPEKKKRKDKRIMRVKNEVL
jgi:serine/threonine protein kinase